MVDDFRFGQSQVAEMSEAHRRVSVLLVDDEVALLRALRRSLPEHDVMVASSVPEGLELYEQHRFDVVFCDLMMPDASGVEFYRQLQRLGPDHSRRVVFMTGGVVPERLGSQLGGVPAPCLRKPFSNAELESYIGKTLAARD